MVDRHQQKKEAITRLKMLDLHPDVLGQFEKSDTVFYSERSPLGGILIWVKENPEYAELIRKLEEEKEIMVYHATHEFTPFGETLSLLYVTKYENDWKYDRKDLEGEGDKYPLAYVVNLSEPAFSEFGTIGIREVSGGLIRVA